MSTEHFKLTVSPAVTMTGEEGEMDTGPMSTVRMELNVMPFTISVKLLTDVDVDCVVQQFTAETSSF